METTQSNQQNGSTYRSISDNFKCEQTKFSNQNRVDSAIKKWNLAIVTTQVNLEDIMLNTPELHQRKTNAKDLPHVKPKRQNETKTESNTESGCQEGKGVGENRWRGLWGTNLQPHDK